MKVWLPLIATGTGAEVWARRLAAGLTARGHTVVLDAVPQRYQFFPWAAPLKAPEGADVTLANSWSAAAFRAPAPLATVFHHVVHNPSMRDHKTAAQAAFHRWFVKPMEQAAIRHSALVIAVSDATAREVAAHFGGTRARIIPNGVDTDFFTPGEPPPPDSPGRPIELLFVGKPSRRKAFDTVAAVVERLGARCRLRCIGGPPERGLVLPPGDYPGRVDDETLRKAYRTADVLLMPSRLEGYGYAAAEAMACGLPVAASAGTAVADLIPDGGGVIRASGDVAGLAADILDLAADAPRRAILREALRAHAVAHLSESRWLDRMEAALLEVANTPRRSG